MQRREVQQLAVPLAEFVVASVPLGWQVAVQGGGTVQELAFGRGARAAQLPHACHACAVDEHHRGVFARQGKKAAVPEVAIEQQARIGEIDLVDVVVDRAARVAGEIGDGKPVVAETGGPGRPVEAGQVFHQDDFVVPRRVTMLEDRPQEYALRPVVRRFGAEKDPDGR